MSPALCSSALPVRQRRAYCRDQRHHTAVAREPLRSVPLLLQAATTPVRSSLADSAVVRLPLRPQSLLASGLAPIPATRQRRWRFHQTGYRFPFHCSFGPGHMCSVLIAACRYSSLGVCVRNGRSAAARSAVQCQVWTAPATLPFVKHYWTACVEHSRRFPAKHSLRDGPESRLRRLPQAIVASTSSASRFRSAPPHAACHKRRIRRIADSVIYAKSFHTVDDARPFANGCRRGTGREYRIHVR